MYKKVVSITDFLNNMFKYIYNQFESLIGSAPKSKKNGKNRNTNPHIDRNHSTAEDVRTSSGTSMVLERRPPTCAVRLPQRLRN